MNLQIFNTEEDWGHKFNYTDEELTVEALFAAHEEIDRAFSLATGTQKRRDRILTADKKIPTNS